MDTVGRLSLVEVKSNNKQLRRAYIYTHINSKEAGNASLVLTYSGGKEPQGKI